MEEYTVLLFILPEYCLIYANYLQARVSLFHPNELKPAHTNTIAGFGFFNDFIVKS